MNTEPAEPRPIAPPVVPGPAVSPEGHEDENAVPKIHVRGPENSSLMTTWSYDGRTRIGVR
jgi:hypothetical protein